MDRQEQIELFADFLHSFLDYQSEEHGNYYQHWSDFNVEIVDTDGKKCTKQIIYQELKKYIKGYGYEFTDDMIIKLVK